jgi:hypothetical protein
VGHLKWAGHLIQINDLTSKISLIVKPEGSRTRGRPYNRWADNIDIDIQTTGGCNLKAMAVNRENWGRLLGRLWFIEG